MNIEFKGTFSEFVSYSIPLSSKWDSPNLIKPKFLDMFYIIPMGEMYHIVKLEDNPEPILVLDEEAHTFIRILDGTKTLDQILKILFDKYPKIMKENVLEVYSKLKDLDLIIEGNPVTKIDFSEDYFLRQERQIRFLSHFETGKSNRFDYQNKLYNSTVLVLGIGGTGSQALLLLAAAGIGNLVAVDFDNVEASNLNRQLIFHDEDIGRNKAVAAKERIEAFNPQINVKTISEKLGNVENISNLMSGVDLCLCCADVPPIEIRSIINQASMNTNVPVIYGGIYADHVNVGPLVVPGETGCFQCWNESRIQLDENYKYYLDYILNKEAEIGSSAANVWLYGTTGAGIAMGMGSIVMDIMRFLSGYAPPRTLGKQLKINLLTFDLSEISWPKIATCPVCGTITKDN